MTSLTFARIRIPVSDEAVPWFVGVFVATVLAVTIALTARLWKQWGLAAWAAVALAWGAAAALRSAPSPSPFNLVAVIASSAVAAAALVWAALLFWGLRRRVDVTGALLAGLAFALIGPPLSAVPVRLAAGFPRPFASMLFLDAFLAAAASAAGLLVTVSVVLVRIKPVWRAALVGLGAGSVVGTAASLAVQAALGRVAVRGALAMLSWSVVDGLILGGLAAAAVRWLKAEERTGDAVLAPAGRA